MLYLSGGPRRYFQSMLALWSVAGGRNTVLTSPVAYCTARVMLIFLIGCICFGTGLAFAAEKPGRTSADRDRALFTWIWIAPGLLFFTLVFLLFVNSGYLLVLTPPLFAYLGRNAYAWFARRSAMQYWRAAILCAVAGSNTAIFVFAPFYCSYRSVRQFEAELVSFNAAVRRTASPATTLLVGFDSHFLGYRHAAYYLPEYQTVQFPEIALDGKRGAFSAQDRQTKFIQTLPVGRFDQFVLLPLPPDDEDRAYMALVRGRFPPAVLADAHAGEWSFAFGAIADLKVLFAHAAGTE
jgi:hypothetical protein